MLPAYDRLATTFDILFVSLVSGWLIFEVTLIILIKSNESVCAAVLLSWSEFRIV